MYISFLPIKLWICCEVRWKKKFTWACFMYCCSRSVISTNSVKTARTYFVNDGIWWTRRGKILAKRFLGIASFVIRDRTSWKTSNDLVKNHSSSWSVWLCCQFRNLLQPSCSSVQGTDFLIFTKDLFWNNIAITQPWGSTAVLHLNTSAEWESACVSADCGEKCHWWGICFETGPRRIIQLPLASTVFSCVAFWRDLLLYHGLKDALDFFQLPREDPEHISFLIPAMGLVVAGCAVEETINWTFMTKCRLRSGFSIFCAFSVMRIDLRTTMWDLLWYVNKSGPGQLPAWQAYGHIKCPTEDHEVL